MTYVSDYKSIRITEYGEVSYFSAWPVGDELEVVDSLADSLRIYPTDVDGIASSIREKYPHVSVDIIDADAPPVPATVSLDTIRTVHIENLFPYDDIDYLYWSESLMLGKGGSEWAVKVTNCFNEEWYYHVYIDGDKVSISAQNCVEDILSRMDGAIKIVA